MKIIKMYETTINLSATEMYANINLVIMDKLKKFYEGRCEKNTLIVKVLEIVKRSMVESAKSRLDGSGDADVSFIAEAIVYNDNDILTGCEVQKIERGNKIICKYGDHAVVNIKGSKALQSLKPGQKITIKISSVSYMKAKDKITIYGVPYSYVYRFTMYATDIDPSQISFENVEIIKKKIADIDEEYNLYKQADKKIVKLFNETYYPFKKGFDESQKELKNLPIEIIDVYELAVKLIDGKTKTDKKGENIFVFRHPIIDKSTPIAFKINETDLQKGFNSNLLDPQSYQIEIINENIAVVLLDILNDYLSYIRTIREMTEIYPTEKEIESHADIWAIYNRLKK